MTDFIISLFWAAAREACAADGERGRRSRHALRLMGVAVRHWYRASDGSFVEEGEELN